MCAQRYRPGYIIFSTVIARGLRLLQLDASLHSNNNRHMMKARQDPTERWLCMWFVYCGCPGNPQRCSCLLRVLLSYYMLWSLHTMTSGHEVWLPNGFKAFQIQPWW